MTKKLDPKYKPVVYAILGIVAVGYIFLWAVFNPALLGLSLESSFMLSPDSRLPRWFQRPPGYDRTNLTVKIYYYSPIPPVIYDLRAELLGPPPDFRLLERKFGKHRWHPDSERRRYQAPSYVIASIDGIDEIVEHKAMEPIFYISDDAKLIDEMKQSR